MVRRDSAAVGASRPLHHGIEISTSTGNHSSSFLQASTTATRPQDCSATKKTSEFAQSRQGDEGERMFLENDGTTTKGKASTSSRGSLVWDKYEGRCKQCKEKVSNGIGLFCANYHSKRKGFPPCMGIWCGGCYTIADNHKNLFPVVHNPVGANDGDADDDDDDNDSCVIDFSDIDIDKRQQQSRKQKETNDHDKERLKRFMYGRVGDHLMVQFQCDLCHFRNIRLRDPKPKRLAEDRNLLICIRRANLDALWAHEPSTVQTNFAEGTRFMDNATRLGGIASSSDSPCFPSLGPLPLEDACGMFSAACILIATMDVCGAENSRQTKTSDGMGTFCEYDNAKRSKAFYSRYWEASVASDERLEMCPKRWEINSSTKPNHDHGMFVSSCPVHCPWYDRFTKGMHKRIGWKIENSRRPKLTITIDIMHHLMEKYENEWQESGEDLMDPRKVDILFPALFAIISFCGALNGKETCLMDLAGTRTNYDAGMNHPPSTDLRHVIVALYASFKSQISEKYHLIPIAASTFSGLNPGIWVSRMLDWYHIRGIRNGPVFRDHTTGQNATLQEFQWNILSHLHLIQSEKPDLIPTSIFVLEKDYHATMNGLFRRGSQRHVIRNRRSMLSMEDIDWNNRWRKFKTSSADNTINNGAEYKQLQIQEHYSDVLEHISELLKYSIAL